MGIFEMEWKTIESLPKDREYYFACHAPTKSVGFVRYGAYSGPSPHYETEWEIEFDDEDFSDIPTHWMKIEYPEP